MSPENWSAIIAAGAALAGALVVSVTNLVAGYLRRRQELARELRVEKREVYARAAALAYAISQTGSALDLAGLLREAREVNQSLVLFASSDVVSGFNALTDNSPARLQQREGLTEEESRRRYTETVRRFLNAVRADLHPHLRALEPDNIRFIEPTRPPTPSAGRPG